MPRPVAELRNLGPKSARMLAEAGIDSVEELARIGAVDAWRRARFVHGGRVSLNLLWALHAGLAGRDWRALTAEEKAPLRAAVGEETAKNQ